MPEQEPAAPPPGRLTELRTSARGWQGIQLAVLGFIGLCGVLKQTDTSIPHWLQVLAGLLALVALALACYATYLVGRAAFPLYRVRGRAPPPEDDPDELAQAGHRLVRGLVLTFVAVALTALAAASAWWPSSDKSASAGAEVGLVELQTQQASACGRLADSDNGQVRVEADGRTIGVPFQALVGLVPVDRCP